MHRFAFLVLAVALSMAAQPPPGAWLDSSSKQWNRAGRTVPKAEKLFRDDVRPFEVHCRELVNANPETPEEHAVAAKGWMTFGSERDGSITVVTGAQDFDGMCRLARYQDFVFVNGTYAGTISPVLMDSRSDGAAVMITFPAPARISAEFQRYTDKDPLCCPSRISEGTYEVQYTGGRPSVALTGVRTRRTD